VLPFPDARADPALVEFIVAFLKQWHQFAMATSCVSWEWPFNDRTPRTFCERVLPMIRTKCPGLFYLTQPLAGGLGIFKFREHILPLLKLANMLDIKPLTMFIVSMQAYSVQKRLGMNDGSSVPFVLDDHFGDVPLV